MLIHPSDSPISKCIFVTSVFKEEETEAWRSVTGRGPAANGPAGTANEEQAEPSWRLLT